MFFPEYALIVFCNVGSKLAYIAQSCHCQFVRWIPL